jgi:hypothetical protein
MWKLRYEGNGWYTIETEAGEVVTHSSMSLDDATCVVEAHNTAIEEALYS